MIAYYTLVESISNLHSGNLVYHCYTTLSFNHCVINEQLVTVSTNIYSIIESGNCLIIKNLIYIKPSLTAIDHVTSTTTMIN